MVASSIKREKAFCYCSGFLVTSLVGLSRIASIAIFHDYTFPSETAIIKRHVTRLVPRKRIWHMTISRLVAANIWINYLKSGGLSISNAKPFKDMVPLELAIRNS
jgi:hypothetical protein